MTNICRRLHIWQDALRVFDESLSCRRKISRIHVWPTCASEHPRRNLHSVRKFYSSTDASSASKTWSLIPLLLNAVHRHVATSLLLIMRSPQTAYATTYRNTGTYFSRAFVFDGELALLFAVIDVAQLVIEQIRGRRRRQPSEEHRE